MINKYKLRILCNGDSIEECLRVIRAGMIENTDTDDAIKQSLEQYGYYEHSGYFYDIAQSKQFKMYKVANENCLYNMSIRVIPEVEK